MLMLDLAGKPADVLEKDVAKRIAAGWSFPAAPDYTDDDYKKDIAAVKNGALDATRDEIVARLAYKAEKFPNLFVLPDSVTAQSVCSGTVQKFGKKSNTRMSKITDYVVLVSDDWTTKTGEELTFAIALRPGDTVPQIGENIAVCAVELEAQPGKKPVCVANFK